MVANGFHPDRAYRPVIHTYVQNIPLAHSCNVSNLPHAEDANPFFSLP
jgi:hypothetical protein